MTPTIQLRLLLATFAGWAGLQQSRAISYLIEENRILKEQLESRGKRVLFTDDQRRRLAAKGEPLGRRALEAIATIVTPDTILRWLDGADRSKPDGLSDSFLTAKRFLIIDRDALLSPRFKAILESSGVEILLTAYRAPNMNAFAERFVRSIESEWLSQMVFVGQHSLDRGIAEYVARCHNERSHQGIGNQIVSGAMPQRMGQIEVKERLGGLLNYCHRRAA